MFKKYSISMLLLTIILMLSGCTNKSTNEPGLFHTYLVNPIGDFIHFLGEGSNGNYGLAIILITLIIRLVLMPLMLNQYKKQQAMKEKMEILKPEMEAIQKKMKETKDQKIQQELQKELFGLYQKYNVNPFAVGCLPLLLQMPILMGLYYAIRSSADIATHSFLWFNLGSPDLIVTFFAGLIYYLQFKVSQSSLSSDQQKQMAIMGWLSPVMIVIVSFNAPAALPLYWCIGGLFLIGQTLLGQRLYKKKDSQGGIVETKI